MGIPLDAAPMDDAHLDDPHARAAASADTSLRYRMLVQLISAHDRSFEPPAAPHGPLEILAEHIVEVERRCAEILRHLHPDERARIEPFLPIDVRPH
jgi:hypothetical protein